MKFRKGDKVISPTGDKFLVQITRTRPKQGGQILQVKSLKSGTEFSGISPTGLKKIKVRK